MLVFSMSMPLNRPTLSPARLGACQWKSGKPAALGIPHRRDILGALENLKNSVDENTKVLIYYAGHGHEEKAESRGYWLPVDAEAKNPNNWIANDDITSKLKAMPARHVLVIADSCYSGSISRGDAFRGTRRTEPGGPDSKGYLQKVAMKKSRKVLTSSGEEPVMDGGGKNGHSVFASALLDALQDEKGGLDGYLLLEKIRKPISYNAEQNPEFDYIPSSGHDGGGFCSSRVISHAAHPPATDFRRPACPRPVQSRQREPAGGLDYRQ